MDTFGDLRVAQGRELDSARDYFLYDRRVNYEGTTKRITKTHSRFSGGHLVPFFVGVSMASSYSVKYVFRMVDKFTPYAKKLVGAGSRIAASSKKMAAGMQSATTSIYGTGRAADHTQRKLNRLARTMRSMRTIGRGGLGAGISGGIGALSIGRMVKQYANYEDALISVRKVWTGSQGDYEKMVAGLPNLNKSLPLDRMDIAKLLEEGIRADVAKTPEALLGYVKLAGEFATAFQLPIDQASVSLAKLKSQLGLSLPELRSLGDTMNTVANSFSLSEKDMLEYTRRVGSLGKALAGAQGVKDLQAIGAAQIATGVKREVAGTGTRTLLLRLGQMKKPTQDALKQLKLNPKEVAKGLTVNLAGTVREIMQRIGKMPKHEQGQILGDLAGMRAADAFIPLIANLDMLDKTLAKVNGSFRLTMASEFARRNKGLNATLTKTMNVLRDFADSLVSYWRPTIDKVLAGISRISENLKGNSWVAWTVGAYGLLSALGMLLLPLGMLAWSLTAIGPLVATLALPFLIASRAIIGFGLALASGALAGLAAGIASFAKFTAAAFLARGAMAALAVVGKAILRVSILFLGYEAIKWLYDNWGKLKEFAANPLKFSILFPEAPAWLSSLMTKSGAYHQQANRGMANKIRGYMGWEQKPPIAPSGAPSGAAASPVPGAQAVKVGGEFTLAPITIEQGRIQVDYNGPLAGPSSLPVTATPPRGASTVEAGAAPGP